MPHAHPIAAYLDATVAAQHAGVADGDVVLLQEIGEDIAAFALTLFEKVGRLTTAGAMGTSTLLPPGQYGHPKAAFVAPEPAGMVDLLLQTFDEDGYGYELDATDVIATAARLRLGRSAGISTK